MAAAAGAVALLSGYTFSTADEAVASKNAQSSTNGDRVAASAGGSPRDGKASPERDEPVHNDSTAKWRIFTDVARDLTLSGRYVEADKYLRRALEEARAGFGDGAPHVGAALNNLAEGRRLQGRFGEAAELYREALAVLQQCYGTADVRFAQALENFGSFHLAAGSFAEAEAHLRRAIALKQECLGPAHLDLAAALLQLAEAVRKQGRLEDAVRVVEQCVALYDTPQADASAAGLRARARLAELLVQSRRMPEAEQQFRRILASVSSSQDDSQHGDAAAVAEQLALALRAQGQLEEARQLLHSCLDTRTSRLGGAHPAVGITLRHLADLELEAGRTQEGMGRAARAVEIAAGAWQAALSSYEKRSSPSTLASWRRWATGAEQDPTEQAIKAALDQANLVPPAVEYARSLRTRAAAIQQKQQAEDQALHDLQAALKVLDEPLLQVPEVALEGSQNKNGPATSPGAKDVEKSFRLRSAWRTLASRRNRAQKLWQQERDRCQQELDRAAGPGAATESA